MPEASTVRRMFAGVAPRYDLLNHLLSLGIDRRWRRDVVSGLNLKRSDRVLDVCCGTGDLALELAPHARCLACDFTWEMLTRAKTKSTRAGQTLRLAAADALRLPFPADQFDAELGERATNRFAVVDDKTKMALGIGFLGAVFAQLKELVTQIDKGATLSFSPQGKIEDCAIELERFFDIADLEHHVIDAERARFTGAFTLFGHGGPPSLAAWVLPCELVTRSHTTWNIGLSFAMPNRPCDPHVI